MIRHLIITAPCSSKMHNCVTFGDNHKGMEQNFLSSDQNFCFVSSTLYLSSYIHIDDDLVDRSFLLQMLQLNCLHRTSDRSLPMSPVEWRNTIIKIGIKFLLCITTNNINIMTISFLLGPPPLWCSCHKNLITNKWFCWTKYRLSLPKIDIYCKYGWSDAKNWC